MTNEEKRERTLAESRVRQYELSVDTAAYLVKAKATSDIIKTERKKQEDESARLALAEEKEKKARLLEIATKKAEKWMKLSNQPITFEEAFDRVGGNKL